MYIYAVFPHSWNRDKTSGITSLPHQKTNKKKETAPGVGADCGTVCSRRSDAGSIARKLLIKCFGGCSRVIFLHQTIRDLKVFPSFQSSGLGFCLPLMDGPVSLRCVAGGGPS